MGLGNCSEYRTTDTSWQNNNNEGAMWELYLCSSVVLWKAAQRIRRECAGHWYLCHQILERGSPLAALLCKENKCSMCDNASRFTARKIAALHQHYLAYCFPSSLFRFALCFCAELHRLLGWRDTFTKNIQPITVFKWFQLLVQNFFQKFLLCLFFFATFEKGAK